MEEKRNVLKAVIRKTWKILRAITLVFLSLVLLLALLVFLFEDKIKNYAVEYLNSYLNTEVRVESIDLNLISTFPYASLEFTNVIIKDPPQVNKLRDTLLYTEKLYLQFSLWDLLSNDYSVEKIAMKNADLRLYIDEKGNENYVIWKSSESKEKGNFSFKLKDFHLENVKISYRNKTNFQDYQFKSQELRLKGNFTEDVYDLESKVNTEIIHFKSKGITFIKNKKTELDFNLNINRNKHLISFNTGRFRLGDMNFDVEGSLSDTTNGECNINIKGKEINIHSLLKTFPSLLGDDLEQYSTEGELKFFAQLHGPVNHPEVKASFNIENASLHEKTSGVRLKNLNFKGELIAGKKEEKDQLLLEDLSGKFNDAPFNGKILLQDFENPKMDAALNGNFDLRALHQFFKFKEVEQTEGFLSVSAKVKSRFVLDKETETWSMDIQSASGNARVEKMALSLKDHPVKYSGFDGEFSLQGNNAFVENLNGNLGKSDIMINGVLQNLVPYLLLKKQKLNVVADLQSELIDLNDLLAAAPEKEPKVNEKNNSRLKFPSDINFNLNASVNKIEYSTFEAKNLRGNFKLIDKVFSGDRLSLLFAKGLCTGNLEIDGRSDEAFAVTSSVNISDMDIRETFVLFKNFGQEVVTDKNVKGTLSATVSFGMVMDPTLKIDQNKIVSVAQVMLKNGELNELQSFKDIADYMRKDKKIKMALGKNIDDLEKRLNNIRFSELKNTISIKNGIITIPEMDIKSSALTVQLSGEHHFDNQIDYHINFRFMELLIQETENEYGYIVDDGTGFKVYIHMFGDLNNPKFESDSEERKADRKAYNQEEIKNIKAIMKEEFGLFKKDSTIKIKETPKEEVKFLLEWDQNTGTEKSPEEKPKEEKKKDNKEKVNKLKKKLGATDEEEKTKIEIE